MNFSNKISQNLQVQPNFRQYFNNLHRWDRKVTAIIERPMPLSIILGISKSPLKVKGIPGNIQRNLRALVDSSLLFAHAIQC